MIPRTKEFVKERVKELIEYYDYKHEEGYSYGTLSAIAHIVYLKHKHIESDKLVYKLLEDDMKLKALVELGI